MNPDLGPRWEWLGILGALATFANLARAVVQDRPESVAALLVEGILAGVLTVALLALVHAIRPMPPAFEAATASTLGYLGVRTLVGALKRLLRLP